MEINTFTVGPFAENTYLLSKQKKGLLIDPGFNTQAEFNSLKKKLEKQEITLTAVVLTHAHIDHILGLHKVKQHYDIPVYLSEKDRYLWNNVSEQASAFGFKLPSFNFAPQPLPAQGDWSIGSFTFDTRYTPGHAPDHIALYNKKDKLLIAGDTLFKEGVGRTDLYKGDMQQLKQSIKEKLYTLPDQTTVYPGHGSATTIGHEKTSNPFVQG